MNKIELIEALETSHETVLTLLEGVPAEELTRPGASGDWSAKDILSHLLIWEAETIKLLYAVQFNRRPETAHFKTISDDEQNKIWFEQFKDRAYDRVWNDYTTIRDQLIERIQLIQEADLQSKSKYSWLKGGSLENLIQSFILDHETEHAITLKKWRASLTG